MTIEELRADNFVEDVISYIQDVVLHRPLDAKTKDALRIKFRFHCACPPETVVQLHEIFKHL